MFAANETPKRNSQAMTAEEPRRLRRLSVAGCEPLSLSELAEYVRADESSELAELLEMARERVETETGRTLREATYLQLEDRFPVGELVLMAYPVRSVAVKYLDTGGTEQTLATTEWEIDLARRPQVIMPAYGKSWPDTLDHTGAVRITIEAGPPTPADVPATLREAVRKMVDLAYSGRGMEQLCESQTLRWILNRWKVHYHR